VGNGLIYEIGNSMLIRNGVNMWENHKTEEFDRKMLSEDSRQKLLKMVAKRVRPQDVGKTTETLWDMRKHALQLCRQFEPLPADYDCTLETWLAKTSYTAVQKQGFRDAARDDPVMTKKLRQCKSFMKAETYPEYKYPRPIKSRTDAFKAFMGPIFQGINEKLFANTNWFIKKIPVEDRPRVLADKFFPSDRFDCTDFSSYESHFIDMILFAIEFPLYIWLTSKIADAKFFREELETLLRSNTCVFKDFKIECMSRASGEMNTSSGNGWSNLCVCSYIARAKGCIDFKGQFEGDDGLTKTTPPGCSPTTQDYKTMGWVCKLIVVPKFEEASFCGIVADIDDLINVCDIRAYIADFGWSKQQYTRSNNTTLRALIRAKGYSAVFQYPGCPIIDSLGRYALRVTDQEIIKKKFKKMMRSAQFGDCRYKQLRFQEMMERHNNKIPPKRDTPEATRALVHKLFKVSPEEQVRIETYLDGLEDIHELDIDIDVPEVWRYNWDTYVNGDINMDTNSHKEIAEFKKFCANYNPNIFDIQI